VSRRRTWGLAALAATALWAALFSLIGAIA
jgi:hypothetical protein